MDTIQELRVVEKDRGKLPGGGRSKENDDGPRFCEGSPGKSSSFLLEDYGFPGLYNNKAIDGINGCSLACFHHATCPLLEYL